MRSITYNYISLGCILIAVVHNGHATQSNVEIKRVTDSYLLAEGPHWDHRTQKLYFVDIVSQRIYRLDTATGAVTSAYVESGPVGVAVPVDDTTDKLAAGVGRDFVLVTWDGETNETRAPVQVLCHVDDENNGTRINDGKVDSFGRFWLGTMGSEVKGKKEFALNKGSLYRIDDELKPTKEISPVSISNGIAWNIEDDTFYYIDSLTRQVAAYDYDPNTGTISNKKIAFDMNKTDVRGFPDGMTIDTDGNLWIALFEGNQVIQVDPKTSKILRQVELPVKDITSVAFGGPLLDILYVTTSSHRLTEEEQRANPQAGAVFEVKNLGVRGILANTFRFNEQIYD